MTLSLDDRIFDTLTTSELLRIAACGDHAAWETIVRRFEPAVAAMISGYRLQEADARDATQRTWLRMLENHQQIREPEALGGWLKTTAAASASGYCPSSGGPSPCRRAPSTRTRPPTSNGRSSTRSKPATCGTC